MHLCLTERPKEKPIMKIHYKLTIYSRLAGKFKEEYILTSKEISINPLHFVSAEKKVTCHNGLPLRHNSQTKENREAVLL